jgi:serine/threonine-protein kinase
MDRWQQISQLYHDALARGESQRTGFLDAACAGDDALRREVDSLVARERSADDFLARPAVEWPQE